jgi:RNA polymerase sigma-70 factor, ECF subfamily
MDQQGDEALWIEQALAGDKQAFAQIVERYSGAVYNLAYRMLGSAQDAEDAAQEIFLRAYMRLASYDRERKFSTWLLTVASNYCIDRIRRRRYAWVTLDDVAYSLPSLGAGPERSALQREQREAVQQAIQALPENYRLITVLRYWNDLSYAEIAEVTGLTEATVKTRLFRARKMLADMLDPAEVATETSS